MDISIIVPVYNSEEYIESCISSLATQNFKGNYEIIAINDGSTDKSKDILKQLCEKYGNLTVYNQTNQGASEARNLGIEMATGEYLMFVDSDDYISDNMLKTLYCKIKQSNDIDMVISGLIIENIKQNERIFTKLNLEERSIVLNEFTQDNAQSLKKEFVKLLEKEYLNSPCGNLYKRNIIIEYKLKMEKKVSLQEDLLFNINYLLLCKKVCLISDCFYYYVHRESESVTKRYTNTRFDNLFYVQKSILNLLKEKLEFTDKELENVYFFIIKNMYSFFITMFLPSCQLKKDEKKKLIKKTLNYKEIDDFVRKSNKNGIKYKFIKIILQTKNVNVIYLTSKLFAYLKSKRLFSY